MSRESNTKCSFTHRSQLKQQLNRHERTLERHNKILEERDRETRQYGLVLYGLPELDVQPVKKDEEDVLREHIADTLPGQDDDDEASHVKSCKRDAQVFAKQQEANTCVVHV